MGLSKAKAAVDSASKKASDAVGSALGLGGGEGRGGEGRGGEGRSVEGDETFASSEGALVEMIMTGAAEYERQRAEYEREKAEYERKRAAYNGRDSHAGLAASEAASSPQGRSRSVERFWANTKGASPLRRSKSTPPPPDQVQRREEAHRREQAPTRQPRPSGADYIRMPKSQGDLDHVAALTPGSQGGLDRVPLVDRAEDNDEEDMLQAIRADAAARAAAASARAAERSSLAATAAATAAAATLTSPGDARPDSAGTATKSKVDLSSPLWT